LHWILTGCGSSSIPVYFELVGLQKRLHLENVQMVPGHEDLQASCWLLTQEPSHTKGKIEN